VDWPYEANATGIEFLKKISISDADREKIAHGNAERVLRMYSPRGRGSEVPRISQLKCFPLRILS